jgi:phosphate transport system permease protein
MTENIYSRRKFANRLMLGLCGLGAAISIIFLLLILGYTIFKGASYFNIGFLINSAKPVGEVGGGMRDEIIGTLILVGLGSIIAVPIGLMTGVFLSDFGSPKMRASVRFSADILSGVPSIVVGMFVYALMVATHKPGYSAISAAVALAIIMIPVVARTAEESLLLVPNSMREAALALGITRWRSLLGVIIPGAITGIVTGIMLGVARIAGETAPLLLTAFGSPFGFRGLTKPIGALPVQIYHYALSAYPDWQQQAWAGAFLLIVIVLIINIVVRWLSSRRRSSGQR